MAARPRIVVANKIDVPGAESRRPAAAETRWRRGLDRGSGRRQFASSPVDPKLYRISALTGEGVDGLKAAIATKVHELREELRALSEADVQYEHVWEHKREERDKQFKVVPLGGGVFRVEGPQVERMVVQTDWENEEAIAFLQHRLKRLGVEKALEKASTVDGDEIVGVAAVTAGTETFLVSHGVPSLRFTRRLQTRAFRQPSWRPASSQLRPSSQPSWRPACQPWPSRRTRSGRA